MNHVLTEKELDDLKDGFTKEFDFGSERDKLVKSHLYWRPENGDYTIRFLSEPYPYEGFYVLPEGDRVEISKFAIMVNDLKDMKRIVYIWDMSRGCTTRSIWGQICVLKDTYGKLKNKSFDLNIKGGGNRRRYNISKAHEIMDNEGGAKK